MSVREQEEKQKKAMRRAEEVGKGIVERQRTADRRAEEAMRQAQRAVRRIEGR